MLSGNTVDNLRVVGSSNAVGHPQVAALEAAFLRQHVWFPEHNAAVHHRWTFILEHIPEMRSRHLYDDLADVYRTVAYGGSSLRLFAAYDMSVLQHRLWDTIVKNGMCLVHVHGWQTCACQAWQRRLLERLESQKSWRRAGEFGKIKKPVSKPPPRPGNWFH